MTLQKKTLLVTLRINVSACEMDEEDKAELLADNIESKGLDDYEAENVAECLEGIVNDPELFAGSEIWARFDAVKIVKAEWEE